MYLILRGSVFFTALDVILSITYRNPFEYCGLKVNVDISISFLPKLKL